MDAVWPLASQSRRQNVKLCAAAECVASIALRLSDAFSDNENSEGDGGGDHAEAAGKGAT